MKKTNRKQFRYHIARLLVAVMILQSFLIPLPAVSSVFAEDGNHQTAVEDTSKKEIKAEETEQKEEIRQEAEEKKEAQPPAEEKKEEAKPEVKEENSKEPQEKKEEASEKKEEAVKEAAEEKKVENNSDQKKAQDPAEEKKTENRSEEAKPAKKTLKAAEDELITCNIVIVNQNRQVVARQTIDSSEFPELEYGSIPFGWMYGDTYGTYQKGYAWITRDGARTQGYFLCFDGENATVLGKGYSNVEPGDLITLNIYYDVPEQQQETVYGEVKLNVSDGRHPVEGYEIIFTGKKGAETRQVTVKTDEKGVASEKLDESYKWTYKVEDRTYEADFTDHVHRNDLVVKIEKEEKHDVTGTVNVHVRDEGEEKYSLFNTHDLYEEGRGNTEETVKNGAISAGTYPKNNNAELKAVEVRVNGKKVDAQFRSNHAYFEGVDEGEVQADFYYEYKKEEAEKIYKVYVKHQFNEKAGGTLVDGSTDSTDFIEATFEKKAGEKVTHEELTSMIEMDGKTVLHNGGSYRLGAVYTSGGESSLHGSVTGNGIASGQDFTMIHSDVKIIFNYTYIPKQFKVTVRYLDDHGNVLKEAEEKTFTEGTEYDVRGLIIHHYTPEGEAVYVNVGDDYQYSYADEALTGTINSDLTVNAYFEKTEEPKEAENEPADINEDDYRNDDEGYRDYDGDDRIAVPAVPNTPGTGGTTGTGRIAAAQNNAPQEGNTVRDSKTPLAQPGAQTELKDSEVPLAQTGGAWALVNLLMTIATVILSAGMLVFYFFAERKKEEEDEEKIREEKTKRRGLIRVMGIIPAAASVIAFILTEDMTLPMQYVDRWTALMAVILVIEAAVTVLSRKKREEDDDDREDMNEANNVYTQSV